MINDELKMFNKQYIAIIFVFAVFTLLTACQANGDFPGREYMPDMAHSQAYEAYTSSDRLTVVTKDGETMPLFQDGKSAREPVAGTVARGYVPYYFEDTEDDRERAGRELVNPFNSMHADVLEEAKLNFNIYCAVCHGEKGDGQGTLIKSGVYPPPPSYFREDIMAVPEGRMFHSIHYGKNLMGSYASQLTKEERWKVVSYIKQMQAEYIAKEDSTVDVQGALNRITGGGVIHQAVKEAVIEVIEDTEDAMPEEEDTEDAGHTEDGGH